MGDTTTTSHACADSPREATEAVELTTPASASASITGPSPPLPLPHSRQAFAANTRRFRYRNHLTRDRDVLRYIQTWSEVYKPAQLHRNLFPRDAPRPVPAPCPDTALAAFAQLAALRMQTQRCLISLTCATTEWVLADFGQKTSLQYNVNADNSGDLPWIGTGSFARRDALSDQAIEQWRKARRVRDAPEDSEHYYTRGLCEHSFVINDLRHDREYENSEFARSGPWIRFHCSVPLRDAMGSVLGSLTVLDDKPRFGVGVDELTLLEDISDTIVEHLSATVTRARQERGNRLISSLGLFHAGEGSLRDWWLAQDDTRMLNTGRNVDKGTSSERQDRVDGEFGLHSQSQGGDDDPSTPASDEGPSSDHFGDYGNGEPGANIVQSPVNGGKSGIQAKNRRPGSSQNAKSAKGKQESDNAFDLVRSTATTYRRAANLLREALGADGVTFVDAASITIPLHPKDHKNTSSASESELSEVDISDSSSERAPFCKIQGASTRNAMASPGTQQPLSRVNIPEYHLQQLIKRCPRGFVCHFDRNGQVDTSSDENSSQSSSDDISSKTRRRTRKEFTKLGKLFAGAKVLSVYPLWDDGYRRWRSCIFVWSTSMGRCLDQSEDLMFLKTFGNSLMAELSRLEIVAADTSKATFISSISHELRSPLHGILAGVEFLHDTPLTDFQLEMAHAISMAGRTLLDTVNHVLDYSKIKGSMKRRLGPAKTDPLSKSVSQKSDAVDAVSHTDLARLTEEVVETTVTAHRLHSGSWESSTQSNLETNTPLSPTRRLSSPSFHVSSGVTISLSITHRKNWMVATQPGAWTRILTNLVGNAIKYTSEGHIAVKLDVGEPIITDSEGSQRCPVQLSVEDTGIGMSDTFLAHGLYTPFEQENPHAEGTGLGLSIVKQIARSMRAELEISSRLGKGTTAKVRFMAHFVEGDSVADTAFTMDSLPEWSMNLKVDQLQLLPGPSTQTNQETRRDDADTLLSASVLENAKEWLACSIVNGTSIAKGDGTSLCGITERNLIAWQTEHPEDLHQILHVVASKHSHLFVFGQNMHAVALSPIFGDLPLRAVYIHQPIGPRKLLRAIASDRDSTVSGNQPVQLRSPALNGRPRMPQRAITSAKLDESNRKSPLTLGPAPRRERRESSNSSPQSKEVTDVDGSIGATPCVESTNTSVNSWSVRSDTHASPQSERDTVLLVEDNEVNMRLLIALVTKLQIPYQCATNGLEALRMYTVNPSSFLLILMDMSMPVMDGFTATSKIRQEEKRRRWERSFITALTGVTDAAERRRAFECGVDEFRSKPMSMGQLRKFVEARRKELREGRGRKEKEEQNDG